MVPRVKLTYTRLGRVPRVGVFFFKSGRELIVFVSALEEFRETDAARSIHYTIQYSIRPDTDHCDHKFIDSLMCLRCGWKP